ncbi:MAG: ribonuclease R, partial [Atopococcus tabaci]|nr:ribonuclease R [Atopococcus tabaci]
VDILSVVYKHGIPTEFSPDTLREVEEIPDHVQAEEKEGRLDLTETVTITIDGADAKDLDDAISLEKLENGNYYLGVHIADVSHYVKEGSSLDKDAFERGSSSYLTDRVIPMLPRELSNGICSLHPNVERLTMTCFMEINDQGKVLNYHIEPSVIRSHQRMTYDAINGILEEGDPQLYKEYEDYISLFENMGDLHKILEKKRYNRGAINFDTEESQVLVDEEGQPVDIVLRPRGIGERLIESFMLQANETVSEHFTKKHLPILYRVHERPDMAKMQSFIEFASALGIKVSGTKDTVSPKQLQKIIENVEGKDEELVVSMTLLRSMQQARYDIEDLGHFGLAAEYYSHFTSPIRRYPDLTLHRLIHHYQEVGTSKKDQAHYQSILPEIAEQSSMAERRAIDAEREVDNMKKVEFMADKVGQKFEAIIVSVLGFGMFVQLENTVEGLIHISKMKEDYFDYNEQGKMMIGKRTGKTYRMGEKVEVRLVGANTETYELDFELIVDKASSDQGKKQEKSQDNSKHNRKNRRRRGKRTKKSGDSSQKSQSNTGRSKDKNAKQKSGGQKSKKKHFKIIQKDQ